MPESRDIDTDKLREAVHEELERERGGFLHQHHGCADAVALFQVAIALGALAALTRSHAVWLASLSIWHTWPCRIPTRPCRKNTLCRGSWRPQT